MQVNTNTMPLYEGLEHLWTSIWGNEYPDNTKEQLHMQIHSCTPIWAKVEAANPSAAVSTYTVQILDPKYQLPLKATKTTRETTSFPNEAGKKQAKNIRY